jgi:hypothetical protein
MPMRTLPPARAAPTRADAQALQAGGASGASDLGRRVSDFNLDDLLGLSSPEPPQSPAPSAAPGTPAAARAASADPFQARAALPA